MHDGDDRARERRSTIRQDAIVDDLRRGIADGTWAPGSRLPTRQELQKRFDAASVTVQRSLDRLAENGYVVARGRSGTFVVDHPPRTGHYALVLPAVQDGGASRFWLALANEAEALSRRDARRRITVFAGIDGRAGHDGHQQLVRDLRLQRLAGIVFAVNPFELVGSPVVALPDVRRIAVMDAPIGDLAAARLDSDDFIAKALDHFRARRRTRIAVLTIPGLPDSFRTRVLDAMAARWMGTRPYWWHTVAIPALDGAKAITHLLTHRSQHERPDALLIADDNLVESAVHGLIASGIRVPEELDVVAHCNFPWPTPAALPVRRLGFDAREVLETCLGWIDAGAAAGDTVRVPARFEDERPATG